MSLDEETEHRILEKAEYIGEAVEILSTKQSLDVDAYLERRQERDVVEREFETAIEACIDIAELLILHADASVPNTNAETFTHLVALDILSEETGHAMADAAKFRNVLAHTYGDSIDDRLVYQHLQDDLHWFRDYLNEVRIHLADE